MDDPRAPEPDLPPSEAERLRRRDRERSAKGRELMRTGQAKAFKQILDAQARRAAEAKRELAERDRSDRGLSGRGRPRREHAGRERDAERRRPSGSSDDADLGRSSR